ncbi:uncharacterized protein [Watersipora subatra]|uniref:uncharacterized protein n=1 Tax=Watersipora subatra TaxID=2589382 RepID=UPI00355B1C5B
MKRESNDCGWDDTVPGPVQVMIDHTMEMLKEKDPVGGQLSVPDERRGSIWCDASNLAIGVSVEIDGQQVEDGCWLRKDDGNHINVTVIPNTVIRGVSCGGKWGLTSVCVIPDSATVNGWVNSIIINSKRPKVCGLEKMLTRRRLRMIAELVELYDLDVKMKLAKSEKNLADTLTRVSKKWLKTRVCATAVVSMHPVQAIRDLHDTNHLGVDRTFYLARRKWGDSVSKKDVEQAVKECQVCRQVDPSPVRWDCGKLAVEETWVRLASDITQYRGTPYMTVVDCGPSRFPLWRQLRNETAEVVVVKELEQIFYERGLPKEFLSDNCPCYRSQVMRKLVEKRGIEHIFSCAYRQQGNGIAERQHRTVKRMMARTGRSAEEMLYWHNFSPKIDGAIPAEEVYKYEGQHKPDVSGNSFLPRSTELNPFKPGDVVYVKPPQARCTTQWQKGKVTSLVSNTAVKVDSISTHISDLRLCNPHSAAERGDTYIEVHEPDTEQQVEDDSLEHDNDELQYAPD